jgi:hypothetical protein
LPRCLGLRFAGCKTVPVGQDQALVHDLLELAGVIGLAHRVLVGHLFRLDEVAAAQRDTVHADLARGLVHQPLHDVDGLGPARAAVAPGGCGVGQHRLEVEVDGLDVVHAGLHPGADQQLDGHTRARGVGAHIGQGMHRRRPRILPSAASARARLASAGRGRGLLSKKSSLRSATHFTGRWRCVRGPGHGGVFRVDAGLHAKAAAHVAHDDAHLIRC